MQTPLNEFAAAYEEPSNVSSNSDDDGGCPVKDLMTNKALFAVVSITCFATAVAAGSYAIWLSRRKVAEEAITSVNDLVDTCHTRMSQIEKDLNQIAGVHSQSRA